MSDPTILAIIVNYRTPKLALSAAAAAMREMQSVTGEIVIVDNDSQDGSFDIISQAIDDPYWNPQGLVRLIKASRNGGLGAGINLGIKAQLSNGTLPDFYFLLSPCALPQPGAIARLQNFMTAFSYVGIAGSHVRGEDGEPHKSAFRFPTAANEFEEAASSPFITRLLADIVVPLPAPKSSTRVDWVNTTSMMLRREMLDEIGLFDETFFLFFETTELSHRAAQAGWYTHYVPSSEVVYVGLASASTPTRRRTPQYWFDSRLYYYSKTHNGLYAIKTTITRIIAGMIWKLRRRSPTQTHTEPPKFMRDLISHSMHALLHSLRKMKQTKQAKRPELIIPQTSANGKL